MLWAVAVSFEKSCDIECLVVGTLNEAVERYRSQLDKEKSISTAAVYEISDTECSVKIESGFGYTVSLVEYKDSLHLNLKGEFFEEVEDGSKPFEYRLRTKYWRKRLERRVYGRILVKKGYPRADDCDRIVERPWRGYEEQTITHPHFGLKHVDVFAIRVN